jgi:dTDP-4-amino-4,6-dideoxygalactose transaminase
VIRLTRPSIEEDDLDAVRQTLVSGHLVQGPRVAAFEESIADYVGAKHSIVVSNCTAALQMALLATGVGPGDMVIVGAYSWPTSANVVELCGAMPVFADVDHETFNLAPDALGDTLRRLFRSPHVGQRVKAIIPIHVFGQIADMPELLAVAERYGVPIIEDAACALGASLDGHQAGSWGSMGCFSFHPRKAITTGEGGAIVTDDDRVARHVRALRNHGQDPSGGTPDPFMFPGFNNRMTEFQAALGVTQMAKLDRVIAARRALAAQYDALLDPSLVRGGARAPDARHVFQSYVVLLPRDVAPQRSMIIAELRERGVETQIGTWNMPLITFYRSRYGYSVGQFPVCDDIAGRALTLPLYEGMTADEQHTVVEELRSCLSTTAAT